MENDLIQRGVRRSTRPPKHKYGFLAVAGIMAIAAMTTQCSNPAPPDFSQFKGDQIHGQVYASYKGVERAFLAIPDVEVYVVNTLTADQSDPVKTTLNGEYIIPRQPAGSYRVCWRKDGWVADCGDPFTLLNVTAFPGWIGIEPAHGGTGTAAGGIVRGHVQLADGGTCWFDHEFFELEETAVVELFEPTTGAILQQVRANTNGDFVLTGTPTGGPFQIRTQCDNEIVLTALAPHLVDLLGIEPLEVTLPNNTPRIKTVIATDGAKVIRRAPLGATVEVSLRTEDLDGDVLEFDWRVIPGSGSLSASTTDTVAWTLPSTPGRHFLYVVVSDQRGGRYFKRLGIPVGVDRVAFGGLVVGSDGPPIPGANVTVNGVRKVTDANGAFLFAVPAADNYVLHIEAAGYVEVGRRLQSATPGTTWVMTKASRQVIDPFVDTVIVDSRRAWTQPPEGSDISRQPSRLIIGANTLIGVNGEQLDPANGPFTAYFATVDSNTELLAGDYGAVDLDGRPVFMESFGAAFTDVRDAMGRKYTLQAGAVAVLEGAIQTPQLNNAIKPPANMGLFIFDPPSGNWIEQQQVARRSSDGAFYSVELPSFSTANFDKSKGDPACLRVFFDQSFLNLGALRARVDLTTGTSSVERREIQLADLNNAFYNMPPNTPFTIEVFQTISGDESLFFAAPGNTGAAWGGTGVPPLNYTVCDPEIELTAPTTPTTPQDLSPFLKFNKGTISEAEADAYIFAIDPLLDTDPLKKKTLGIWWAANGFNADGSGGTRTSFLNHNDLGFGRDMHCLAKGAIGNIPATIPGNVDIACYVTNYGEPDQDPDNANLAQAAIQAGAIATVAMEYSAAPNSPNLNDRIVKFYVFVGGDSNAPITNAADLDGAGPRFIPQLCLICHGGNYAAPNTLPTPPLTLDFDDINLGSSFREFDPYTFKYPDNNLQVDQDLDFLTQNEMVYHSKPAPAIQELLEAFYAGGATVVDPDAIPAGWSVPPATSLAPQEELYLEFIGKSCRTCHVAQSAYVPTGGPYSVGDQADWGTYASFAAPAKKDFAYFLVCTTKQMPNALITFKNMWLSAGPHRPEFFGSFEDLATGWDALGPCDP